MKIFVSNMNIIMKQKYKLALNGSVLRTKTNASLLMKDQMNYYKKNVNKRRKIF